MIIIKYVVKKCSKVNGKIKVSGSKNAALPIIVAAILIKEKVTLKNVPYIKDVIDIISILNNIGVITKFNKQINELTIISNNLKNNITSNKIKNIRASYYLIGALISRIKEFEIDYPGGCNFTNRPIDIHLTSFKKLNIEIQETNKIKINAKNIKSNTIYLPIPSVGATINIILATIFLKGTTIIKNSSIEPEVIDLINFLNKAGANIKVINNNIIIKGVIKLHKLTYNIIPDRIEAGSYLLLASSIPYSKIIIKKTKVNHLKEVIRILRLMGNKIYIKQNTITLKSPKVLNDIFECISYYPFFPTDLQPILCSCLYNTFKESSIIDNVYYDRISHIKELRKLNVDIKYINKKIIIKKSQIISGEVYASDLRCGFAMIISGVNSNEKIIIDNANIINRGYDKLLSKLNSIGIKISIIYDR